MVQVQPGQQLNRGARGNTDNRGGQRGEGEGERQRKVSRSDVDSREHKGKKQQRRNHGVVASHNAKLRGAVQDDDDSSCAVGAQEQRVGGRQGNARKDTSATRGFGGRGADVGASSMDVSASHRDGSTDGIGRDGFLDLVRLEWSHVAPISDFRFPFAFLVQHA